MLPPELVNGTYSHRNTMDTQYLCHGQPMQPFVTFDQAAVAVDGDTEPVLAYIVLEAETVHIFHIKSVTLQVGKNPRWGVCVYALVMKA